MKTRISFFFVVFFIFYCDRNANTENQVSHPQVLIIKAAGYIEGEKPQKMDSMTEATSVGRNVHIVSQAVADELQKRNINTVVVSFNDLTRIQGLFKNGLDLIIFAGPSYSSRFPNQLQEQVTHLKDTILLTRTLCTSLTTCRFLESGGLTVQAFDQKLKEQGIQTIDGLVIHHEYEDKDWETKVRSFADLIQNSL